MPHARGDVDKIRVWRGDIDREEILAIRAGQWDYDELVEWAEAEDQALHDKYKSRDYVVPKAPNRKAIDQLCIQMVEQALK